MEIAWVLLVLSSQIMTFIKRERLNRSLALILDKALRVWTLIIKLDMLGIQMDRLSVWYGASRLVQLIHPTLNQARSLHVHSTHSGQHPRTVVISQQRSILLPAKERLWPMLCKWLLLLLLLLVSPWNGEIWVWSRKLMLLMICYLIWLLLLSSLQVILELTDIAIRIDGTHRTFSRLSMRDLSAVKSSKLEWNSATILREIFESNRLPRIRSWQDLGLMKQNRFLSALTSTSAATMIWGSTSTLIKQIIHLLDSSIILLNL